MIILYIWARKLHRQTWGGWGFDSLREWGQYTKLAIPGLLMTCFEWWSVEVTFVVSGSISETELAVNSIGFQLLVIMFMVSVCLTVHGTLD